MFGPAFDRTAPGAPHRPGRAVRGFTLVELMVALTIIGILAAIATPSFTGILNANRLAGLSNDVIAMLQNARMESMRRGVRVVVCPTTNGTACTTGAQWNGWIAFADHNANNTVDVNEMLRTETLRAPLQLWTSPAISGTGSRIVFRPDGFAYDNSRTTLLVANLTACIPTDNPIENARDVSVVTGTRISVAARNASAACVAPANP